jgi:hypothetical protein
MPAKTTEEILNLAIENNNKTVEVSLLVGSMLRSTHFIEYQQGIVLDEGCDGIETKKTTAEFLSAYPDAWWKLDQIC